MITDDQEKLIRLRAKTNQPEEERWRELYRILFPKSREIPSPCTLAHVSFFSEFHQLIFRTQIMDPTFQPSSLKMRRRRGRRGSPPSLRFLLFLRKFLTNPRRRRYQPLQRAMATEEVSGETADIHQPPPPLLLPLLLPVPLLQMLVFLLVEAAISTRLRASSSGTKQNWLNVDRRFVATSIAPYGPSWNMKSTRCSGRFNRPCRSE